MIGLSNLQDDAQYLAMQRLLDVPHYIDYITLHFYVGHEDWGLNKNWYALRKRASLEGFKYLVWDGELMLNSPAQNRVASSDPASGLHRKLSANSQYRLDFADRIHRHLLNRGALSPEVELAMVAESARWGDYRRDVHRYSSGPYVLHTRDEHLQSEKERLLTQYFPGRTETLLSQLRAGGLYPSTAAPAFSQHGGRVTSGFSLHISAPLGTVHFTRDGTHPRVPGTGAATAGAQVAAGPDYIFEVSSDLTTWRSAEVIQSPEPPFPWRIPAPAGSSIPPQFFRVRLGP